MQLELPFLYMPSLPAPVPQSPIPAPLLMLPVISNSFIGLPKFPSDDDAGGAAPAAGVFDASFDASFA